MKPLVRALLALLLGLSAALPVLGDSVTGGGEGGVWILPRSTVMTGSGITARQARASCKIDDLQKGLVMQMSSEVGVAIAVLTDPASNLVHPLAVNGHDVILDGNLLVGLHNTGVASISVTVVDENGLGYAIDLAFETTGAMVYVY
ncbi:MAG: hypothetical protein Fur0037_15590 [Planctomycetota bacterium]